MNRVMDSEMGGFTIINEKFNNFEHFAQMTKFWDLDFLQLDRGDFEANVLQIASPKWQVSKARFNRKLDQSGKSPPGLRTFGLLRRKSTPIIWHGHNIDQNDLLIFPEDGDLDSLSFPGFDVFTFSYSEDLLFDVVETIGIGHVLNGRGAQIVRCDRGLAQGLLNNLNRLVMCLSLNATDMSKTQLTYQIEYEIPRSLILAIPNQDPYQKKPTIKNRLQAVKKVKEYVNAYKYDEITVRDLCKAAFVSERTLRYAFNEYFGISPKKYIKIRNLNLVKRDLARYQPDEKSVTDIANRWGFWHMGQFAKDYKVLFGELPSKTRVNIFNV